MKSGAAIGESKIPKALSEALGDVVHDLRTGKFGSPLVASVIPLAAFLHFEKYAGRVLYIVPDDNTALDMHHAWNILGAECGALVSWGVIPYSFATADKEKEYHRTHAEYLIRSNRPCLIAASVEGLTEFIAQADATANGIVLKNGDKFAREKLTGFLTAAGYNHANPPPVTKPGEFCVKGGIVDIFPPDAEAPVRIDFFGDDIESIKAFSHETQRSFADVKEVRLSALRPHVHDLVPAIEKLVKGLAGEKEELPPILATLGANPAGYADVYPALRPVDDIAALWQNSAGTTAFVCDGAAVVQRLNSLSNERKYLFEKSEGKYRLPPEKLFVARERIETFLTAQADIPLIDHGNEDSRYRNAPQFGGRLGLLKERIAEDAAKKIWFFIESDGQRERLKAALTDLAKPAILPFFYPHGFSSDTVTVFTEKDVFGRVVKKYAADKKISKILESYTDLKEGDYVVHVNYGIGRFHALKRMKIQNTERDFLELVFADNDKLFVPLDQLNLVHKYIGSTENPRLDYLGKKSSWAKTRARVKRLVDSIAEELIELYALRQQQKGFAFGPDSSFQHDFEAAFPFTETEHQLEAIQAIKHDMESDKAMDRLVCGDVGFGKTEVAIRAAFKAAMAGKQVAVLCPTTILAFQHYRSFSKRFADYPLRIDFLSRFRTAAESAEIKQKLADGKIDIIIGTHALIAGDVKYKSLGLLVIDEEQRFGVQHKEKLRQMKNNLDCLALTATPIPRTLHMSLSGIRDLSIIETPPADRRKIETHVLADNEELLRMAMKRELDRGGQVYVLHNKVKTIEEQAARLKGLVPNARIAILHGQMPENEIEEVMVDFYQHAYDILVSTTIIESGIDIPNCNTLIVLSAHEFGLSQLYQLKGRVGRSERQAYAYFFHPHPSVMPMNSDAERRLEVLSEYDDLGSGFKIAMKDLEIRGAGNLLGKEQSGEIMEIGFELYSQMLSDKIAELKGQERAADFSAVVTLPCDWYFPDDYIADTREKMEFYKAFSAAENMDEYRIARESLIDRFGKPPEVVDRMLHFEEIRQIANALRIERIAIAPEEGPYLIVSGEHRLDMVKVSTLLTRDKRVRLDPADPKRINLAIKTEPQLDFFRELKALLKSLAQPAEAA
ncbi:MAG: transcription-repair coupling factor [Spirochaetes bacterium]|nr:transcription-repair coupling factor [Spirochaetota bacterium]